MLGREELDFVFSGPTFVIGDQPHAIVMRDHDVCLVWQRNSRVRRRLFLEQDLALGHVVARFGFERMPGYEEHQMRQLGVRRRVEMSCSSVALLGALVVGTDRMATVPSRLARVLSASHPLRILPVPIDLQPQHIDAYWHRGRDQDPASQWFREALITTARELRMLEVD
jgi:LysR family transcriptional regulator, nod-box dependent transcriptional activator